MKNPGTNAGDITDRFDAWVRKKSLEERHGNPLQYFCLENPMDRGALWAMVRTTGSQRGRRD